MICLRRGVPLLSLALLALGGGLARADLFVSSGGSNQVPEYDSAGNFVRVFASGNGLNRPQGLVLGLQAEIDDAPLLMMLGLVRVRYVGPDLPRAIHVA